MTTITSSALLVATIAAITYFIHQHARHLIQLLPMAFFLLGLLYSPFIYELVIKLLNKLMS